MNIYTLYDKDGKEAFTGTLKEIEGFVGYYVNSLTTYIKYGAWLCSKYRVQVTGKIKKKRIISVYEKEQLIFKGSIKEVAQRFGMSVQSVNVNLKKGWRIQKKYQLKLSEQIAKYPSGYVPRAENGSKEKDFKLAELLKVPYEYKGTKMILTKDRYGKLIKTTFLPL